MLNLCLPRALALPASLFLTLSLSPAVPLTLLLANVGSAQETSALFNGTSLDDWSGDARFWSVEDGELVGRSTEAVPCLSTTYLSYEGNEFRHFDLSLEFKIEGEGSNSGVQFRSVAQDDHQVVGYQADMDAARAWTGGVYEQGGRGVIAKRGRQVQLSAMERVESALGDPDALAALGAPGEWHTYRVRALGTNVQLWVNGVLTCDLTDHQAQFDGGLLAFQMHQGPAMEVRYRNIQIERLDAPVEPGSIFDNAQWIWAPGQSERAGVVRFEKSVTARGPVTKATLAATCDDGVEFSWNGEVFAGGAEWWAPFQVDLPAPMVAALGNGEPQTLLAECWNSGGPGALIACMTIEYADGTSESFGTDRSWKTMTKSGAVEAEEHGAIGSAPWGIPTGMSSGLPDLPLTADQLEVPPGFSAEQILRVPRAYGSWVALTVDNQGRLIASAEAQQGLFRVTLDAPGGAAVEPLGINIGGAQGLLAHGADLFIMRSESGVQDNGLYRARDTNGDGQYDELTLITRLDGSGEHGPHAIRLSPDGEHLEVIAGNSTAFPAGDLRMHVSANWQGDQLLPSLPDTFGHGNAMHDHGGWIGRCRLDGTEWEILCTGMRNSYSFAYDARGERFTFDSDMEWDMGAPWYRAPRVLHLVPGVEFGWRRGSGKIMEGEPDTPQSVTATGPASPVGVLHGHDGGFPGSWRNALFIADWTRGIVYSVDLARDRDTFVGDPKPFISGRPFPITDIAWLADGSMAVVTGGRGRRSALYRVAAAELVLAGADGEPTNEADMERPGEAVHPQGPMADQVRRARLELNPNIAMWAPKALEQAEPVGVLALARVGGAEWQDDLLNALIPTHPPLPPHALRAIEISLARAGLPGTELKDSLRTRLEAEIPGDDTAAPSDVKLAELLVALDSPLGPAFAVPRMLAATSQEQAIDFALQLRRAKVGWTPELASTYLDFLHVDARQFIGGHSIQGYLDRIRAEALENAGAALKTPYEAPPIPESAVPSYDIAGPLFVEQWSLKSLSESIATVKSATDRELGERSFRRAGCYACHRVVDEGGGTGPDLTNAGGRFTAHDLLISILEPSRDVSDQYRDTEIWTQDGEVHVGRLVEHDAEWSSLQLPPSSPGGIDGELVDIPAEDIKLSRPHPFSRMPSGMLDCLQKSEVIELVAWLLDEHPRDTPK